MSKLWNPCKLGTPVVALQIGVAPETGFTLVVKRSIQRYLNRIHEYTRVFRFDIFDESLNAFGVCSITETVPVALILAAWV